ncbi:TonB-dependent siderophore receptor [Malikia sp.]|uniref:TonB-dependent receptor n=1 Tax=Malikia sp. TaxID=2070706 RepID=UPI00260B58B6|nr:TonB-dependent siderophore receptor [Malikia sp.]MDD2729055.1 TonB-dependent siderophore receptor [Malikia sp.]
MNRIANPPEQATAHLASNTPTLLPLGVLLLAGSFAASAQTAPTSASQTLSTVTVSDSAEPVELKSKNSLRASSTQAAKGRQELRDIPQTVTVMTELLIDDRNLDDLREVLKTTAGVTFMAGETGEEDVRLRGFSLGQAGDIYVDGLRDAPLIERDTFNHDRVEVLKGSASMLFGKGSTGGVVNQVSKAPFLMDQHEVDVTIGSGQELRVTGDFNLKTGEDSALRINAMTHDADNHGASVNKKGIAPSYRWGIGTRDEFSVGLYHLETDGQPLYNHPWFVGADGKIEPSLPARNYYGLASDYLKTESTYGTFSHTHRFDHDTELKTQVRHGRYERELLASAIRFAPAAQQPGGLAMTADNLSSNSVLLRNPKARVGYSDLTQIQSDYSGKFQAFGQQHSLLAGVDLSHEDAERNNSYTSGLNAAPTTRVGTPNDGASVIDTRLPPVLNTFRASNVGLYAQDTVSITDTIKLIAGLRLDHFDASYHAPANGGTPTASFQVSDDLISPRLGALYQPSATESWYASFGTSYNTSGDSYQFALGAMTPGSNNARIANTPPEKSRNFEFGGKFELFDNKASLGVALFHSEKYNERNTDEPTADSFLLSGKRHATGMEFNLAGRITPKWELFYNHSWIPEAKIDEGVTSGGNAQQQGDRPALTPKHSASLWTTYRIAPQWRLGAGLNYRGEQNPEGARHVMAKAFTTVDAMAEYQIDANQSLKLNLTNLTDELYADSLYRGFYAPGAARQVQLSYKVLF